MIPDDLLALFAPASAGNCSLSELGWMMVAVPVGAVLASPVFVLLDMLREGAVEAWAGQP